MDSHETITLCQGQFVKGRLRQGAGRWKGKGILGRSYFLFASLWRKIDNFTYRMVRYQGNPARMPD
ncbi:MAG: hypothetical protein K2N55_11305 [Lachnospiraceae bacterium]|nr:hypothetical protein [Lachnospiraceae bacterium]